MNSGALIDISAFYLLINQSYDFIYCEPDKRNYPNKK